MAFHEVTMLGDATIYRTGTDIARNLKQYEREAAALVQDRGNFAQMEAAYKFSVAKGRLRELQDAVVRHEKKLDQLKQVIEGKITELAKLGVMKPGDIAAKVGMMGVAYVLPGIGWLMMGLSFLGIDLFGSKKKKEKRAAELLEEIEELVKQAKFEKSRIDTLSAEGRNLSQSFDKGSDAITVEFSQVQKKEVRNIELVTGPTGHRDFAVVKRIVDAQDPYLMSSKEMAKRGTVSVATRLPESLQTLYSPAFKGKAIVTQRTTTDAPSQVVTGQRLVYGGLSASPIDYTIAIISALLIGWLAHNNKSH